jgi:ABC-type amino acid transport substrate-binding protein
VGTEDKKRRDGSELVHRENGRWIVRDFWHRTLRGGFAAILLALSHLALAQAPKAVNAAREDLTIDPESIMKPWTGDLDQMVERRIVRVLVVPSKTFYFNDKGRPRGATYDAFQLVDQELVKELKKNKKLTRKHLKVQFFFVPVGRDEIFSALMAGKGDIAAANLSITPQRMQIVDFTAPHTSDVQEVVLTGPRSPAVSTLDDLAGKEVFVRKSSSYYEYLVQLNNRFAGESKPLVKLKEAPDDLEDEDLIEMLNAGLVHGARCHHGACGRRNRLGDPQGQPAAQGVS